MDTPPLALGDKAPDNPEPVADATAAFRTSLGVGFGNGLLLGCVGPDGGDVAEGGIVCVEGAGGGGGGFEEEELPALPLPPAPASAAEVGEADGGEDVDAKELWLF